MRGEKILGVLDRWENGQFGPTAILKTSIGEVWMPNRTNLVNKLMQCHPGDTLKVVYEGMGEVGTQGQKAHIYRVSKVKMRVGGSVHQ